MREEMIKKADEFIRRELIKLAEYQDNSMRMAEYRIEHSYRVAHIGLQIARAEGLDEERTYVACLLHDIGYAVDFADENDYTNHGRYGAAIARPFLQELGYSAEDVNEMCFGIAIHVDDRADFEGERTPLALTIGDADNIDRFDAFRLYENLHNMDYMNLPLSEQKALTVKRMERLKQLRDVPFGTDTAAKLWYDKIDYQIAFYNRLRLQAENSSMHY